MASRGHVPRRTCAGCRATAPKHSLLRVFGSAPGVVTVDEGARERGRGGYVHPTRACVEAAIATGGLARAVRTGIGGEAAGRLREQLFEVQERM